MDVNACNFDPEALVPNLALCTYPAGQFLDCDGNCTDDADGDGVCDQFEIPGCTDPEAQNYNPQATDDNGTCRGCTIGGRLHFALRVQLQPRGQLLHPRKL